MSHMRDQVNSLHHFQQHSRLHFIGQWKTKMGDLFQQWFEEHPEWNTEVGEQRTFIHIDMDAFFCSVQLAKNEYAHLRDKPVAIAAGRFNSDISSCNYVARKFGVSAGQYVTHGRQLCPDLILLGYDLEAVNTTALRLYEIIFTTFAPRFRFSLEVYSIDEVVVATDSTDLEAVAAACAAVREQLSRETNCTASCGIAHNIMLARLCTKLAKPDGQKVIQREDVASFMKTLPFNRIHGAGESTVQKVYDVLVRSQRLDKSVPMEAVTCGQVQQLSETQLAGALGRKAGLKFYHLVRGEDDRVVLRTGVMEDKIAAGKGIPSSLSSSMNYAVRPESVEDVWTIIHQLLNDVCKKLERQYLLTTGARITLLERHPLHPKESHKFMGRGKCVEVHISVRFPNALLSKDVSDMMQHIQSAVGPLLTESRPYGDERRASDLGLRKETDDPAVWTVTVQSLNDIVISDIRGVTVQLSGLKLNDAAPTKKRARSPGQPSLFSAFETAKKKVSQETESNSTTLFDLFRSGWSTSFCKVWREGFQSIVSDPALEEAFYRCAVFALLRHPDAATRAEKFAELLDGL